MNKSTETLLKKDPDFFSRISQMRKVKSGGKTFQDPEKAREAQVKAVESRKKRREAEDNQPTTT